MTSQEHALAIVSTHARDIESTYNHACAAVMDADIPVDELDTDALALAFEESRREVLILRAAIRYTTAPASYDGFGTIELGTPACSKGNTNTRYRKVAVQPEHLRWQEQRYFSGLKACIDEDEYQKLRSAGLVMELPSGV